MNTTITAAETLAAAGDPYGAIRALTDANRTARDRDIETLLVRIRHEGYDALDRTPPAAGLLPSGELHGRPRRAG